MSLSLGSIWRHPLKAIGREEVDGADLTPGAWLPFDRVWAVAHDRARLDGGWGVKANFLRGVTEPKLMAATATLAADGERLTLDHPDAGQITLRPDDPADLPHVLDWLGGIWPADLPAPTRIYRAPEAHLTDVPAPWISVHCRATHRAVEERVGQPLSIHRWRGNLWVEGAEPWEEFAWVGKCLRIGEAMLEVKERITRCKATMANPETGRRDADTLAALRSRGHQDFGVYAEVVAPGRIAPGAEIRVIA
ncbi:MAG: MOSC domain-containing protein [Paracoccaceae bacterium]|nr:MOSC domain-containing protein [Paracoccaceae bacterium]